MAKTKDKAEKVFATPEEAIEAARKAREVNAKPMEPTEVHIPPLRRRRATIVIEGTAPLVTHRWTEKAKEEIRAKQQGRALKKSDPKDPVREFNQSLYPIDRENQIYGFPAVALKKAMVAACRFAKGIAMTQARGVIHVHGQKVILTERVKVASNDEREFQQVHELVPILAKPPGMREDPVRIGKGLNKVADLRYRGEFFPWFAQLHISWMEGMLSDEQVTNLLAYAGYAVGLCENRPEKQGDSWGTFRISTPEVLQTFYDGTYTFVEQTASDYAEQEQDSRAA